MPLVGFVLWVVLGLAQIAAFLAGIQLWWGVGNVLVLIIFFATAWIPFGSLFDACVSFYGAYTAWHWEWWQAALLAFPFAILGVLLNGIGFIMDRTHGPTLRMPR